MPMDRWVCKECGHAVFEKPHKNAICETCHKGRFFELKTCACGKEFHPGRQSQKFCSVGCSEKYKERGGKKGKKYPHLQRARVVICKTCGRAFRAVKECRGRVSVYCSKFCWEHRHPSPIKVCEFCGSEFNDEHRDSRFCSRECYAGYLKTLTGVKSPKWEGGKTSESKCRRTRAEYKQWRRAVFERDNYTCQKCGKRGGFLEAHHIKEACNYPELIYDVNNGICLCHECHKETDNYANRAKTMIVERWEQLTGATAVTIGTAAD